ncbi:hypothetical protein GALL_178590 [mine drainage metagenome]|uniref:DUF302 domain-containing protein n=1 Tax=mine drainage metagenome TaxID=410659 RepID=A0A1J5SIU2_9ZZZZ
MNKALLIFSLLLVINACSLVKPDVAREPQLIGTVRAGMPAIDPTTGIYELQVHDGVSYQDVVDSLKSVSEGMNFVNPANFPIGEHIKKRGIDPQGIKEVRSFCSLGLGTDIFLDHPEFLVFAPCRIAIYEKPDAQHKLKLFIALARPTFDLKSIKNPTTRAKKAAQELETNLLEIMDKASKGDI